MDTSPKDFFYYFRFFAFFFIYPIFVYLSFKGSFSPNFIFSSILLFFLFLVSILVSLGALVDLKKSLEEKSIWTAIFDLLFFLVFLFISSLLLSYFVKGVIYHIL